MLTPTADHLAQHRTGWGLSQPCHRLVPRSSRSLEMVQPRGPAAPGLGGVPAHFSSEVRGVEGEAAGPPAETVPCVSSKGQGRGPAGPRLQEGPVLFTSVR